MKIKVMIFGQLAEFTDCNNLSFENVKNTNELIERLQLKYPSFSAASYTIAVDKKVIKENTSLNPGDTVALLPPFSGG